MGGGAAAADFDDDGFVDLFIPTAAGGPDQLYRNRGDGSFDEVAAQAGVASLEQSRCALWFDYDGDGDLDLLVANDDPKRSSTYVMYRQDLPGFFTDVTDAAGLSLPLPEAEDVFVMRHRGGMAAGDLDNDGDLDLVSCLWNGWPQLLRNEGGWFEDVTDEAGVTTSVPFSHQAMLFDVNGDGWLDIYIAVDFLQNALLLNQRNGTFVDIAASAHADNAWNDMGLSLGDFDRDGDFDLYVTNITLPDVHNILLRNDSVGPSILFQEVSQELNCAEGGWGWGVTFLDLDKDGWLDIAATNGWETPDFVADRSVIYWNRGRDSWRPDDMRPASPRFSEVGRQVGFDDTHWGSALLAFDLERDGDLDLVQTCMNGPLRLLLNDPQPPPAAGEDAADWIIVRPRLSSGANRRAIGAVVRIQHEGAQQMRLITAGTSYLGQEPAEAFFGLGKSRMVERVEVAWPDGRVSCLEDVAGGQMITVTDIGTICSCRADLDGNGIVGLPDLLMIIDDWGPCSGLCGTDLDVSGTVDAADLLLMLDVWGEC